MTTLIGHPENLFVIWPLSFGIFMMMSLLKCNLKTDEQGSILIIAILTMTTLAILASALVILVTVQDRAFTNKKLSLKALYLAEAGIARTIVEHLMNDKNQNWVDNITPNLFVNEPLGEGSYSVSLSQASSNRIVVTAHGYCRTVERILEVVVEVDWKQTPAKISLIHWQDRSRKNRWLF